MINLSHCFIEYSQKNTDEMYVIPLIFLTTENFSDWLQNQSVFIKNWIHAQQFSAKTQTYCLIPSKIGHLETVLIGQEKEPENKISDIFFVGKLASLLPPGIYKLEKFHPMAALAWGMGAYEFNRYKTTAKTNITKSSAVLALPADEIFTEVIHILEAIYLVRDLINTPAEEMNPEQLSAHAQNLAQTFNAEYEIIIGDDLLTANYPAIHAVGRASIHPPRLIDLRWGAPDAPKVTLVGKGVCFDSGGLDIKNAPSMLLMKKDMGGAAHVLGLAYLIMRAKLPLRLRVLIPAVENVISGNAYRPGDILQTRKGLSVEIGNTDAEGRLILADALTEACTENPELLIDMATLTGAARIALGTDLPAFFSTDAKISQELISIGEQIQDPLWSLPLHKPYRKLLNSTIADINNTGTSAYAGAITAALFLKEFVSEHTSWLHFDIMAWNLCTSPAHPEGGEAMGLRTLFYYLQKKYLSACSSAG